MRRSMTNTTANRLGFRSEARLAMPIHPPRNAPEPPRPDHNDVTALSDRLLGLADELARQAPNVAKARQVKEYDGERRKRALALQVREYLKDDSAAAAETKGRASVAYGEQLDMLAGQLTAAEALVAEFEATKCQFDAVRSVLSCLKQISGNI